MKTFAAKRDIEKPATMVRSYVAPLAGVAAVAVIALLGAPQAGAAATAPTCTHSGAASVCEAPGNAQLTTLQPPVQYHPYGDLSGPPLGDHH